MTTHLSMNSAASMRVPVYWLLAAVVLLPGLTACTVGPTAPAPQRYDLGPPLPSVPNASTTGPRQVLALDLQTGPALDGTAMSFRLAYADERQLRAYRDARWAAPVGELLQQRLRAALAADFSLLPAGEVGTRTLVVEVLDMTQSFDRPDHSTGVLRLRATLLQRSSAGATITAQREGQWQADAPSADAAGGARAQQLAADTAAGELSRWISSLR